MPLLSARSWAKTDAASSALRTTISSCDVSAVTMSATHRQPPEDLVEDAGVGAQHQRGEERVLGELTVEVVELVEEAAQAELEAVDGEHVDGREQREAVLAVAVPEQLRRLTAVGERRERERVEVRP